MKSRKLKFEDFHRREHTLKARVRVEATRTTNKWYSQGEKTFGAVFTGWADLFLLYHEGDNYKTIPIEKTNCKRKAGTRGNCCNQGRIRAKIIEY